MTEATSSFAMPVAVAIPRRCVSLPVTSTCQRHTMPNQLSYGCRMTYPKTSKFSSIKLAPVGAFSSGDVAIKRRPVIFFRTPPSRLAQGRRGVVLTKAQEKEGDVGPVVDDAKSFFATLEFWLQAAVVVLTFGFVDAGYSGDWSRIGALSQDTEAQLRVAAYGVVPLSAALVFAIGKRRRSP